MFRSFILTILLLTSAPAMAQTTRPGTMNDTQPLTLPNQAPPQQVQQTPLPTPEPQAPVQRGGFRIIELDPPGVEKLYAERTTQVRLFNEQREVSYIIYAPGGPTKLNKDPIVIVTPEGSNLYGVVEQVDLRIEARSAGRALIALGVPQTGRAQSGRAEDIARQAQLGRSDGLNAGNIIEAVMANESLYAKPTIIGTEGTGMIFQDYLCQARSSSVLPAGMFLMDGGLRTDTAAQCDPPRLPLLTILQNAEDNAVPYAGGATAPVPGQPDANVLSAPAARSFWALAAKCSAEPDLRWIGLERGRLAMQTHNRCSAGGPVVLLTLLEGSLNEEQKTTLAATFVNGRLFQ